MYRDLSRMGTAARPGDGMRFATNRLAWNARQVCLEPWVSSPAPNGTVTFVVSAERDQRLMRQIRALASSDTTIDPSGNSLVLPERPMRPEAQGQCSRRHPVTLRALRS